MTGGRSNSSGAGVSSLVSGGSRNDRLIKVYQENDSKIKKSIILMIIKSNSIILSTPSARAHHYYCAAAVGSVNDVRPSDDEGAHD